MRTRIKFCGCTSVSDAEAAVEAGVDALGVIFAPSSPRWVSAQAGREIARRASALITLVGVFVDPSAAEVHEARAAGFTPQFSGNESAAACESIAAGPYIKVVHVPPGGGDAVDVERSAQPFEHATVMFDTAVEGKHGGSGRTFDWNAARAFAGKRRFIVSGGLTAENVGDCIRALHPYAVDVRSGIETDGRKDPAKMRAFVRAVKEADAQA